MRRYPARKSGMLSRGGVIRGYVTLPGEAVLPFAAGWKR